jgi:ABC-type antimicrobial peptide transport system permease subunit
VVEIGLASALLVALVSAGVPAILAARLRITEALASR